MIPMIDMAKLLAQHGVVASLVTTPHNTARFSRTIRRAAHPPHRNPVPLPRGRASSGLRESRQRPVSEPPEELLRRPGPTPAAPGGVLAGYIISDMCLPWTSETARRFKVPRIVFHGMGCFALLSSYNVRLHRPHLLVGSDSEPFKIPGGLEITRAQLPGSFVALPDLDDVRDAESNAYGVVVNTFPELEGGCVEEYRKVIDKKAWCIGPVSLCNRDKFERGNKASIDETVCLEWLDPKKPKSVLYACLGSQCRPN